ncbi:MAG: tetraacyldisaccharide 4'-kinase [Acidobacteria bacterium]|nr:tetraacyldisaccharide 4'-kinase [Acidobacteriota bacterium]MBS1867325.1 tetraacyldisaccharide 4'-kinase [Acidobacteriota bacterium]
MKLPLPIRILLWPLSLIYGIAARFRVLLYEKGTFKKKRLNTPIISVGNLTVGGTGKTPMVLYLAEKFLSEGKRVGILSRGYRGTGGTSDEVELLRQRLGSRVVFGVGADRFAEGDKIERENPVDVFLLDDGFQHLQLARDADILMMDGSKRMEKWMLPAGSLREPRSACSRADALVISRTMEGESQERPSADGVFHAVTRLLGFRKLGGDGALVSAAELAGKSLYAFCGIGNPEGFFRDLRQWKLEVAGTMAFRDHHRYEQQDIETLAGSVRGARATVFVTTEKDEQNLRGANFGNVPVYIAVIEFFIPNEGAFFTLIKRLLAERRGASA